MAGFKNREEYEKWKAERVRSSQADREFQASPAASQLHCPKCKSDQLHVDKKGFSLGKAVGGGVLLGPVGLLGGLIGSKKIMITCLKCGHKWPAGKEES